MNATQSATVPTKNSLGFAARWKRWSWIYLLLASIAFAALAFAAHITPYFDFDLTIARAVQSMQAGWFDGLMRVASWPGYPLQIYVVIVLILLVLFFHVSRWAAVANIFATVGIVQLEWQSKWSSIARAPAPI